MVINKVYSNCIQIIDDGNDIVEYDVSLGTGCSIINSNWFDREININKERIVNKMLLYFSDYSYRLKTLEDIVCELFDFFDDVVDDGFYHYKLYFIFSDYELRCDKTNEKTSMVVYKRIGKNEYMTGLRDEERKETYEALLAKKYLDFLKKGRAYRINDCKDGIDSLEERQLFTEEKNVSYYMRETEYDVRDEVGARFDQYDNLYRIFSSNDVNAFVPVKDFSFDKEKTAKMEFQYRYNRIDPKGYASVCLDKVNLYYDDKPHVVIFPDGYSSKVSSVQVEDYIARKNCNLYFDEEAAFSYFVPNVPGTLGFVCNNEVKVRYVIEHLSHEQMKEILTSLLEEGYVDLRKYKMDFFDQREDSLCTKWTNPIYIRPIPYEM